MRIKPALLGKGSPQEHHERGDILQYNMHTMIEVT